MNTPIFTSSAMDLGYLKTEPEPWLQFEFKGKFTKSACDEAIIPWIKEFDTNPEHRFVIVWNCARMDGFDMAAKEEWQEVLNQFREKISRIFLVSDSVIVRGAAHFMARFTDLPLVVCKSMDEILVEKGLVL